MLASYYMNLKVLTNILSNNARSGIILLLVAYVSMLSPQLPEIIGSLFDYRVFRVAVLTFIVYTSGRNLQVSIMIAVAFTATMIMLNEQKISSGFIDGIRDNMLSEHFTDDIFNDLVSEDDDK
jgi:hypothetical protein